MMNEKNFIEKIPPIKKKIDEKNYVKTEIEINEKNPTPDEMLAKEKRRLKRAIELLRQQGVDISEDDLDKE